MDITIKKDAEFATIRNDNVFNLNGRTFWDVTEKQTENGKVFSANFLGEEIEIPEDVIVKYNKNDLSTWFCDRAQHFAGELIEITEEDFEYILGCLPPMYRKDSKNRTFYGCIEAYSENVRLWFVSSNDKYYALHGTYDQARNEFGKL